MIEKVSFDYFSGKNCKTANATNSFHYYHNYDSDNNHNYHYRYRRQKPNISHAEQ